MKISGTWLEGPVQAVFSAIEAGGHQVFAVGGCVRNALMHVPISDIDLATDAHPDRVTSLCESAGLKVVPTGIEHGTVTVVAKGQGFEVTTFRKDVETDGRRAVVAFAKDVVTDAERRDFTINALYADRTGQVHDPLGGLSDIPHRRIRFIKNADDRIREDALRILRFFRFYATYGDPKEGLDPDGLSACASHQDMLDGLSAERIGAEMRKLLAARDPAPSVAAMEQAGILGRILPGAASASLAPLVHAEDGRDPRWQRRMAAIGGEDAAGRFRLSKAEVKALAAINQILEKGHRTRLAAYKFGTDAAVDAGLIAASLSGHPAPPSLDEEAADGAARKFPIKAAMLLHLQPAGPELGKLMDVLEAAWIKSDFSLSEAALLQLAKDQTKAR